MPERMVPVPVSLVERLCAAERAGRMGEWMALTRHVTPPPTTPERTPT